MAKFKRPTKTQSLKAALDTIHENFELCLPSLDTPTGFERKRGEGYKSKHEEWKPGTGGVSAMARWFALVSPNIEIILNYTAGFSDYRSSEAVASGHVWYQDGVNPGWFTFDRRGFEDSFYIRAEQLNNLNGVIAEQIKRAQDAIAKSKQEGPRVQVPCTDFKITEAKRKEIGETLRSGKCYTLAPQGMGRAIKLSPRRESRYSLLSTQIGQFFGVPSVYTESIDWD